VCILYDEEHLGEMGEVRGRERKPQDAEGDSGQKSDTLNQGSRQLGKRKCLDCKTTDSPEWRKGPAGPRTYVLSANFNPHPKFSPLYIQVV